MANELVVIEQATALDLFTAPEKVNQMLTHIKTLAEEEQKELDSDLSVAKNRKAFASLAYKVTQTKTAIDKAGKLVVDDLKELPKKVDAARKLFRDELDSLSNGIRKPLTEWEEQEKAREEAEALKKQIEIDHEEALQMNELFDLRKAEEERQRITREEEMKRQAAEQARLEAERKAQQEIEAAAQREREAKEAAERAEREKQEAIQRAEKAAKEAKEKAERDAKEAQERAEREKQLAIEAERKKAHEAEQARLAEEERKRKEDAKRQEDKEHRRVFNQEALKALVSNGFDESLATEFIKLVASNQIPHMTMNY
ncbi:MULTISPECIES: cell envelope biogenesis protein TolA [Providencia]|uniref:cell envelope biogenesis protein TolA n=1 Tax=Providencia TaxID=586 RepID=UPI00141A4ED1|nr:MULTISPECIES: cell envelope biogenesis protein TolA [Providencia]NIA46062.1 cell envelope biogenesis protein TolA [Providencia rettgeri]NIA99581.1 cell envelope biogenesis protein TolA [Providencia rettgeri]NIB17403.1 cell envelope biogenesis protein TolA [Providencia rettgeri]NIB37498.1 cell envelope biogenesis protein TolA [Providencia rettgeri]NIL73480.1 cell envelope biogenesis protein TolA [Providencia sp. 504mA]